MKRILTFILFTIMNSIAIGQCPAINIFTSPGSASNTQRPSMLNNFDWLAQKYNLNTIAASPGNNLIWSPI
jgi:hypothetical protein